MGLEQKAKETKWIFRYLRGDKEEIDMGPYDTGEKAQEESDNMAGFGAMCTPAVEVPTDYELFTGEDENVEDKVDDTPVH